MTTQRKTLVASAIVLLGAALVFVNLYFQRSDAPEVDGEPVALRELEAIVSASGTIQPQLSVDMSASVMGRVTRLDVNEGDRVTQGQFLLQIDPESAQTAVNSGEASLRASESAREQARVSVRTAEVSLQLARETLDRQEDLWDLKLVSREVYDQAVKDVELRETELAARTVEVATAEQRIAQERARLDGAKYDLTLVTLVSPMDGIVTRRNIEQGETVVIGTMNNAGTVLLTIADLSILEAELEIDETDIPDVRLGQVAEISIDALPARTYRGRVTEIGNSPILETGQASGQATNFKVVVTLDEDVVGVRPGFTCTADITTATRTDALAVPIQATTVREFRLDADGQIIREVRTGNAGSGDGGQDARDSDRDDMEEVEGVFLIRQSHAEFTPVVTGIAGERYFEALSGLEESDVVVTGPFAVVRTLEDGDEVRLNEPTSDR